ncbi:MAG: hypothetical protein GTO24_05180 [candidate division Zixibacteria bacterium]|nr:hypothetical protein [candidate division Zixibacteria bacterium]
MTIFTKENLQDKALLSAVLYDKGNLLLQTAHWDEAELALNQYLEYETDEERSHIAYNSLGLVYQAQRRMDQGD